ncbi:MAG: DUF927 domain-containing protein [Methylocella sp.]
MLHVAGQEGGGINIFGQSSKGKTTILQAAASVWGRGASPGYVQAWRATANGLEGLGACLSYRRVRSRSKPNLPRIAAGRREPANLSGCSTYPQIVDLASACSITGARPVKLRDSRKHSSGRRFLPMAPQVPSSSGGS